MSGVNIYLLSPAIRAPPGPLSSPLTDEIIPTAFRSADASLGSAACGSPFPPRTLGLISVDSVSLENSQTETWD